MKRSRKNSLSILVTLLIACHTLAAQTGSFQYKGRNPLAGNPVALVSADFNQDGNQDLAVVHYDSEEVSILIGNGNGNFQTSGGYAVEGKPGSITAGDWNGDGKPDLAIAYQGDGTTPPGIAILLGTGDGSFLTGPRLLVNGGPTTVATADFNRDGHADLVISYGSNAEPPFTVFLGNGIGLFDAVVPVTGGRLWEEPPSAQSMVVADLNGDGKLDLVISPRVERLYAPLLPDQPLWYGTGLPDKVAVTLGNGDGSFQAVQRFVLGEPTSETWPGTNLAALAAGDFDGDGAVDVAVLDDHSESLFQGHLVLLRGNGDGGFYPLTALPLGFNYPSTLAACDLNNNGTALVIPQFSMEFIICISGGCFSIGWPPQDARLWIYQRTPDGSFRGTAERGFDAQVDRFGNFVHCSDLNNDGKQDVVLLNGNGVLIWLNTLPGQ
ncbi:MAG: VCBS repeat-containing protein [Acidobacteriia bacterium]|nr:VCBS repeat-containing protein [Terriglobia bacterium]